MTRQRSLIISSALALVGLVGAMRALAGPAPAGPGCQADRRTVVHTPSKVVAQAGSYEPCVVDTGMKSGESGLAIDNKGTLLRSVATGPTGIAVSSDKGATWRRRLLPNGAPTAIADGVIDPSTQRYFYTGAEDSLMYFTDDRGKTWRTGTFDSSQRHDWDKTFVGRPVVRRASGYPNNVYYCNWTIPLGAIVTTRCFKSINGGRTFATVGKDFLPGFCRENPGQLPTYGHGRGIVDPRNGRIYLPMAYCGHWEVAVSADEGDTWTRHVITGSQMGVAVTRNVTDTVASPWLKQNLSGRINPVSAYLGTNQTSDALGMDATGRLYAVFLGADYLPRLATSATGGRTWTKPVRITPPAVLQGVLPSIAVTPQGRVGVSYYGSPNKGATWTGYLTITDNAAAPSPTFQTASVTRPGQPLMPEPCCWASGAQEYTAARWAPDGSLYAAFAASSPSGDAEGMVGRLVAVH